MFNLFLILLSIYLDSLVASIALGGNKIKISFLNILAISIIGSIFLGISLTFGYYINLLIPLQLSQNISFFLLSILGFYKLFESIFKNTIQKRISKDIPFTFKIYDFKFILNIYTDEIKADFDKSKTITLKESVCLATALSFDSLVVGVSANLSSMNIIIIIVLSLIISILFLKLGFFIGNKLSIKCNLNLSWLSGIILIILAFL